MFEKAPRRLLLLLILSVLGAVRWLIPPGPNVVLPTLTAAVIFFLGTLVLFRSKFAANLLALFLFGEGIFHLFLAIPFAIKEPYISFVVTPTITVPAIFFSSLWVATSLYLLFSPEVQRFRNHA